MSLSELGTTPGKIETIERNVPYINDPLTAFNRLTKSDGNHLLLESAEIDSKDNLQSLMLLDAAIKIVCRGTEVTISALSNNGGALLPKIATHFAQHNRVLHQSDTQITLIFPVSNENLDEDARLKAPSVFDVPRYFMDELDAIRPHKHAIFLAGAFAYDLIASFEVLSAVEDGINTCPDYVFYLSETLLLIDHQNKTTQLLGSVLSGENVAQNYFDIHQKLESIEQGIMQLNDGEPHDETMPMAATNTSVVTNVSDTDFKATVTQLKDNILAGDIFQVVPSRCFTLDCPNPTAAYKRLKALNPSPYMFYLKDADFEMFGASPESALKYDRTSNQVEVYPIAGTRIRGKHSNGVINADLDSRIELELREDTKEKSEHLMLVDLARNDIAKVSIPGTRSVKDLLKVDRYSHVMHLVSRVVGQLRQDLDALHAYQACMNMGTLVGAPKVRAAQLVRDVEQQRRGSYGGAVGYMNGHGDLDTCIVIRSAFVQHGKAHIQAGAGVVYDSDPQSEADETRNKANAVITAIQQSQGGLQ